MGLGERKRDPLARWDMSPSFRLLTNSFFAFEQVISDFTQDSLQYLKAKIPKRTSNASED